MGILSRRIHGWQMLLSLIEMLGAAVLFASMMAAWNQQSSLVKDVYPGYFALVIAAIMIDSFRQFHDSGLALPTGLCEEGVLALRRMGAVALIWLGFLAARQDHAVSRAFLFSYLFLLPIVLVGVRRMAKSTLAPWVFGPSYRFGVILLGNPEYSESLVRWLSSKQAIGVNLVGYLAAQEHFPNHGIPWLGTEQDLPTVIKQHHAGLVVSVELPHDDNHVQQLRSTCDSQGARLAFQCRLGGDTMSRVSLCQDDGVSLISLRSEPLQSPFNRLVKRAFDIAMALPVVVFVLPPLAVFVFIVHRVRSPGPLLYRQRRGGLAGNPFTMLKFRTMHCLEHDESVQAVKGDQRVFRGGHWLRKHSIDEFPQFLNVLAGSMSIVGPRPHLEVHDEQFSKVSAEYRVRTLVKPGITGLAQVEGHRGPTTDDSYITQRVKADLRYLENWSFSTDFILVLRTLRQLLMPTNAV
jgi:exopolysaccharide biosynthesis polyprenyl glycosylphosphotransferase